MSNAGGGDWRKRIYDLIAEKGYGSLTDFAQVNPIMTFQELAQTLGADVAPIQIESLLREEAVESGAFEKFARDTLARRIRQHIPNGWKTGEDFEFNVARAFASWSAALGEPYSEIAHRVWQLFQYAIIDVGWAPDGPADEVLVDIFRRANFNS
jgi:hypothetical protein